MLRRTVVVLAGLASAGALAAQQAGQRAKQRADEIRASPDPYDLATLAREPEGETVVVDRPDGTRVHTVVAGEGPAVVLLHGYGASLVEWNLVMPALVRRGMRVVAVDWRGSGRTNVGSEGATAAAIIDDVVAVLDAHEVHDAALVGHSTGGYLSIAMLVERPEVSDRLSGLVLIASLAGDVLTGAPQNRAQIPMIRSGVMQRIARDETLGLLFAASIWGPRPSYAACRVFLDVFLRADHTELVGLLQQLTESGYYDRLGAISLPTVVVCGEEDATTPRWHSESLGRDIPGARNVWVPDAGHMLNWQAPEVLVEAITSLSGPSEE